jgi:hypothetical protein
MKEAVGGQVPVFGKKTVKTNTILVPVDSGGHRFAVHFISTV